MRNEGNTNCKSVVTRQDTKARKAIWRDWQNGMTLEQIGAKWGINPTTARSYAIRYSYDRLRRIA